MANKIAHKAAMRGKTGKAASVGKSQSAVHSKSTAKAATTHKGKKKSSY